MARGTTLGALVTKLRSVLGHDRSPASGAAFVDHLKEALRFAQEELYDEYAWTFLNGRADKTINAGQRYYDFPTAIPFENVSAVQGLWNDQYHDLVYGITAHDYSVHNSDDDERSDPIEKWMILNTGTVQFEVWPLPATAGEMRFHGKKALTALTSDAHTAMLDDLLLCWRAAANLSNNDKLIQKFNARERARLLVLTGRSSPVDQKPLKIGGDAQPKPYQGTIIRVAGT